MTPWVALLRGINVGGHKKVPMADLRTMCVGLWPDSAPKTYIASGNLIFSAKGDAAEIRTALEEGIASTFGFDVPVCLVAGEALQMTTNTCPFPDAEGKAVHAFMPIDGSLPAEVELNKFKTVDEVIEYAGEMVWLHTPSGFQKSKLGERLSSAKGPYRLTARNLNSMRKLSQMLDS